MNQKFSKKEILLPSQKENEKIQEIIPQLHLLLLIIQHTVV